MSLSFDLNEVRDALRLAYPEIPKGVATTIKVSFLTGTGPGPHKNRNKVEVPTIVVSFDEPNTSR